VGEPKGHKRFAAFWDWASRHETEADRRARRAVMSGADGAVLELGVGVGTNWQYLPEGVDYVAIDPDPYMLRRARKHAAQQGRDVKLHQVAAELLPFPDDSFDTVVATLTFCSVEDVQQSLSEVRRVLKPGGEFRFWEHVRPEGRVTGKLFDLITPLWRRIGAGCHPNRRTADELQRAEFELVSFKRGHHGPTPTIIGSAVVPDGHQGRSGT
jgi:ubiquinone/menaquinone biosynthesis C-methylase UbiE